MSAYTHTLLATLGGQPQVVTFTLDLLLRRGLPISEVIVLHPEASDPRLQHSLECLNAEFVGDQYQFNGSTIHLRSQVLRLDDDTLLEDIVDDMSATGALDTIHQLIRDLKQQYRCIHLSVTGGRRLMALTAISAAQLNFKHHMDHIWHIYTPEEIKQQVRDGKLMHISPVESVSLIEIPFVPWRTYFATLPEQEDTSARDILRSQVAQIDAQEMKPQQVADALYISPSTVSTHTSKIFQECRIAWEMPESQSLNYYFLRDKFDDYFDDE